MGGILAACVGALLGASVVQAPINGGNALTLPAQRHLVRMDPGGGPAIWLLAVQQDGADGHGLELLRSDDEAQTFRYVAPIQPDWSERDTPDLLPVGDDLALIYSYEGPTLSGSTRRDVYFQWWRYDAGGRDFNPQAAVRVFDSTSSATAYSRAELARDSAGRLWIQAFRLEADGSSTAEIAVSEDGGATWRTLPALAHLSHRGGGRLSWLGDRLVFVYAMHDGFQGTHFRIHRDADPVESWGPETLAFPEGIYHGAALSASVTPEGGLDLVYKDETDERLYYRYFDGSAFGPRTQIDDSSDWALQPALTRVGDRLYIFYNHFYSPTDYDFRYRVLDGGGLSGPVVLDGVSDFKGYPAAAEVLPTTVPWVPCFFGAAPNGGVGGDLAEVFAPHEATPDDGGGDGTPDAGTPDAGTPDAGAPDAGTPPTTGLLFSDDFNRSSSDSGALGANWTTTGLWFTQNTAITDLNGTDVATENVARCADCEVSATMLGFGVPHTAIFLRASSLSGGDRYQLDLLGNGHVQVQRVRSGATTVLAEVASGVSVSSSARFALSAVGSSPVQLVASVNGRPVASVTDVSGAAITQAGYAGLYSTHAGVVWDDFRLDALGDAGTPDAGTPDAGTPDAGTPDAGTPDAGTPDAGTPDAGTPDAGTPDAGTPDAGTPDAGTPDAGTPDAGTPDAGTPDAGTPDAGTPDAGTPDAGTPDAGTPPQTGTLFTDDFNRSSSDSGALGANWATTGLWFTQNTAITDLNGTDVATENVARCADCQVSATMLGFGVPHIAIFLRASSLSGGDRYQLDLLGNGHVQVQRVRSGTTTVLAEVASGVSVSSSARFALSAVGSSPVQLVASVNGRPVASVTDASGAAITEAGYAGLYSTHAGVVWDDFRLDALGDAGTPDAGTPDAGTPDAGTPDAGTPDAGTPDAGTPPPTGPLFNDNFNRSSSDSGALGANWATSGLWFTQNAAITDLNGTDVATENVARCADCEVSATMLGFGVPHIAIFLRATSLSGGDRYQLDLLGSGHLQIQRVRAGVTTVLADVPSGLASLSSPARFSLTASGSGPVTLVASVNGVQKVSATDSSGSAITASGYAGLYSTHAGVVWDDFALSGTDGSGSESGTDEDTGGGTGGGTDGGTGAGAGFTLSVVRTDTARRILAVDPGGTAYATSLSDPTALLASTDGARSWTPRGRAGGASFWEMTTLSDGTLIADVISGGRHALARSGDHGATWTSTLDLGVYRSLTPHSWAELDGEVFFIEYQTFTGDSTPLRLWASDDGGRSWSVRHTFSGHRHGHGLAADPARHALWVFFGDTNAQSGLYRSTDAGSTWTPLLTSQPGDVVDATVLGDGTLLFGQDISYLPPTPHVATLTPQGDYRELSAITGPAYSTHALRSGGFVVGAAREPGGDIYPPGEVSAHLYTSPDGERWTRALDYPRLSSSENARADVYWELPSGELLLELENVQGMGPGGKGYQILAIHPL